MQQRQQNRDKQMAKRSKLQVSRLRNPPTLTYANKRNGYRRQDALADDQRPIKLAILKPARKSAFRNARRRPAQMVHEPR
jgi:hypothetical protein